MGIDESESIVEPVDEVVAAEDDEVVQVPRTHSEPRPPSARERARHNLIHFPYRRWCRHCVAGRLNNIAHRRSTAEPRSIPVIHLDYCFLRDARDDDLLTCLVGRMQPSEMTFACPCDSKGIDPYAVQRLKDFIKSSGVSHLVCKSDQETSIKACVDETLVQLHKTASHEGLVITPESSAIGESQSNGMAERTIQLIEDDVRTLKSAFEERIEARLTSTHPLMKWLVEHAASLRNRYSTTQTGETPYERQHGQKASDKAIEFGERVFYFIPKKLRAKLNLKWKLGVYILVTLPIPMRVTSARGVVM